MTKYICHIRRENRLDEQETITISEYELDRLLDGDRIHGYIIRDIEMIRTQTYAKTYKKQNELPKKS